MPSQIQLHFALTFEALGSSPPDREDDAGGSTKGNQQPPITRPDDGGITFKVPPGVLPRFDLYVTIAPAGDVPGGPTPPAKAGQGNERGVTGSLGAGGNATSRKKVKATSGRAKASRKVAS